MAIPRLFVEHALAAGSAVPVGQDQAHYLFNVMRLGIGAELRLFNGRDGEWRASVVEIGKRKGMLCADDKTAPQLDPPDLWLLFAPLKKARTDFTVEKATELGVARICPVQTRYTNSERLRPERLAAIAIEAAEQCGAVSVPQIDDMVKLESLLKGWDPSRRIMLCDETGAGGAAIDTLRDAGPGPWAILIGPEGGFETEELERLKALPFTFGASLGQRILRGETASIAALTLWHAAFDP